MMTCEKAFSLVELSIVLVILGLLTGGILTGQNLIRAAELRSVTTEFQAYQTAINIFKDKYFALPGDMRNATDFWGNADTGTSGGECSDNELDSGTGTQTCNGNGDGIILFGSTSIAADGPYERYRVWEHLSAAGLVEGNYSGIHGSGGIWDMDFGNAAPRGRMSNSGWNLQYADPGQPSALGWHDGNIFYTDAANYLSTTGASNLGVMAPEEAWNIDTKVDDGRPGQGKITGPFQSSAYGADCTTTDVATTSEYALNQNNSNCFLLFKID